MWKKLALAIPAVFLASCGSDSPAPGTQPASEPWALSEISIAYNPQDPVFTDQPLRVMATLRKNQPPLNSAEAYVFGFGGQLSEGARLDSPIISEQKTQVHCLRADCREFELSVKFAHAALQDPIRVYLHDVQKAESHLDSGNDDPNADVTDHRRLWREFLRDGASPAHSYYAVATYHDASFYSVSLNNQSASRYLVLAGPNRASGKLGLDASLYPEGQFLTANDDGAIQPESDSRVLVTFDGGALELWTKP